MSERDHGNEQVPEAVLSTWRAHQAEVRSKVAHFPPATFCFPPKEGRTLIAGADVSFSKSNAEDAVVTITVYAYFSAALKLCYSHSRRVAVSVPYVPGYLAFREAPYIVEMIRAVPTSIAPDVVLIDGNGWLHERRAGCACHVGVELDVPCVGVAKNFYRIDGINEEDIRKELKRNDGRRYTVLSKEREPLCVALLAGNALSNPIYVSVGNKMDLETATRIVQACCVFKVPEPIRTADNHSRQALRTGKLVTFCEIDKGGATSFD